MTCSRLAGYEGGSNQGSIGKHPLPNVSEWSAYTDEDIADAVQC